MYSTLFSNIFLFKNIYIYIWKKKEHARCCLSQTAFWVFSRVAQSRYTRRSGVSDWQCAVPTRFSDTVPIPQGPLHYARPLWDEESSSQASRRTGLRGREKRGQWQMHSSSVFGENSPDRNMHIYGWVPLLLTGKHHNIVNRLYPNTKCFWC